MSNTPKAISNPVIDDYRGTPIRKYNRVLIRVPAYQFKKFIDLKEDQGISERDAILQVGIICKPCSQYIQNGIKPQKSCY